MTHIVLEDAGVRAEIVADEGGRVQHLVDTSSGRELLYQRTPSPGPRADFATGSPGGWDELFPNDTPWQGHPDHGRLWSAPFEVLERRSDAATLRTRLDHPAVEVRRRYTLQPAPRRGLHIETMLRAVQDTGPFLWASHPMLAVAQGWRIELPSGTIEPDDAMRGRFASTAPLEGEERARALILPAANQGWSEALYVSGVSEATVGAEDRRSRTRVAWDSTVLRHLWLVTVSGELDLDLCFLFEPCTSRPYRLDEAIANDTAHSLRAGDEWTWWTEVDSLDGAIGK